MLQINLRGQFIQAASAALGHRQVVCHTWVLVGLTIVCCLLGSRQESRAYATSSPNYTIYMYDSGGTPVDVTVCYFYTDQHLYDHTGTLTDNVLSDGTVQNVQGQNVGYMVFAPPS
jgi:hypothetical protein